MITFKVSKVRAANKSLRTINNENAKRYNKLSTPVVGTMQECVAQSINGLVKVMPEACSSNQMEVDPGMMNGFIEAAYNAFQYHYPLIISPDDVWLCIAQGFANHVNAYAEELRKQFVAHEGKELIRIECPGFVKGSATNPWERVFPKFSDKIAEYIGKKRDLVISDFSTTGLVERCASEIVLMDAMQRYFDYRCRTLCGIPEITLLGTVKDWISIKQKALVFSEFGLKWWIDSLIPVLDKIIEAAAGKPDTEFWQSFFKEGGGSGGPYITGWINTLFPYIEDYRSKTYTMENEYVKDWDKRLGHMCGGPTNDVFPIGLSKVPFIWEYYDQEIKMQFLGGFVGISQNQESLIVRPAIGWAVSELK